MPSANIWPLYAYIQSCNMCPHVLHQHSCKRIHTAHKSNTPAATTKMDVSFKYPLIHGSLCFLLFQFIHFDLQFSFDIVLLGTHTYCPLHHTHPLYFWVLGAIFRGAIRSRVNTWTRWHWVLSLGDVDHVISTSFSMSYWWHRAQCPGLSMSWTLLGGDAKSCQLPFNCQVEKF